MDKEIKDYIDFIKDLQSKGLEMQLKFNQLSDDNKQRFWNSSFVQSLMAMSFAEALKYMIEHKY